MLGIVTCVLRVVVRQTTTAWWPFIEAHRDRASRPIWRWAAPLAAMLPPRRSLSRSFAGMSALVSDNGTRAEERRRAAMMRPAGLLPLCMLIMATLLCSLDTQSLWFLLSPDQMRECGAGGPKLWPIFFYAKIFDAKQKLKFWFRNVNMP